MGYTTRIDRALRLAQINMFTEGNGARMGIPKFLIILTDGTQTKYTDAEDPREIGEELRKSGITIFTIGIGSGINKTELVELAGSKENSFAAASFNELSSGYFVKDIGDAVCSAGKITVGLLITEEIIYHWVLYKCLVFVLKLRVCIKTRFLHMLKVRKVKITKI